MKKQYQLYNSRIELFVKPSPKITRIFILFIGAICFVLPALGITLSLIDGLPFHFGYLIGLGIGSLVGLYFYKLFLWNSYGKEVIELQEKSLNYYADYKKFIRNQQTKEFSSLSFTFKPIGYENEQLGVLLLIDENNQILIECATIMPISELEELIEKINLKDF